MRAVQAHRGRQGLRPAPVRTDVHQPGRERFVLYSAHGDSLFLAMRLVREGHAVSLFIKNPAAQYVGTFLHSG